MTNVSPQNPRSAMPAETPSQSFDQELCGLVLDTAPCLFAVVQVCDVGTECADGWVVAWGMVYDEGCTHVVSVDGALRMSLPSPERAARFFARRAGVTVRLVRLAPSRAAETVQREAA